MKYQLKLKAEDMVSCGVYQSMTYDRTPSGIVKTILCKEGGSHNDAHQAYKKKFFLKRHNPHLYAQNMQYTCKLWSDFRKCFTLCQILTSTLTHQGISLPILVRPLLLTAYPIRGSVMASQARPRKRMMDAEKASIYEKHLTRRKLLISHKTLIIPHYCKKNNM